MAIRTLEPELLLHQQVFPTSAILEPPSLIIYLPKNTEVSLFFVSKTPIKIDWFLKPLKKSRKFKRFLGMKPDEDPVVGGPYGPYIQTERLDLYQKYALELINIGAAYYCFCSEESLKQLHEKDQYAKYDRHCRNLSAEEVKSKLDSGAPFVIRVKLPETGFTTWHDLVQGKLSLPNTECDDKVLHENQWYSHLPLGGCR